MRRRIRSRQVVRCVNHLGCLAFRPRLGLQREFKGIHRTQVDGAEIFGGGDLPLRRRACRPGRSGPGMQRRRVIRVHGHPLYDWYHLFRVITRKQHTLQRVAIHAAPKRHLVFPGSRHAREQLTVGELHGELRAAGYLIKLQIQLGGFGRYLHGSIWQLISCGASFDDIPAWLHSVARETVLTLGVAHHPSGDRGARLLCTDDHTFHCALRL